MEEKTYFMPGDQVKLRQELANVPVMYVVGKETNRFIPNKEDAGKDYLQGIKCRWFSTDQKLQEGVFNTKDLVIVN